MCIVRKRRPAGFLDIKCQTCCRLTVGSNKKIQLLGTMLSPSCSKIASFFEAGVFISSAVRLLSVNIVKSLFMGFSTFTLALYIIVHVSVRSSGSAACPGAKSKW